jgi:uncharacterized protein involved in exopolysaccharide biosynthesis
METAREKAGGSPELLALTMKDEFVNPVYNQLDTQVATSEANLAALEKQAREIVIERGLDKATLKQLSVLYEREAELARLQMEYEIAQKVYAEASTQYESAKLKVASQSAQFVIVDPALPPDRPAPRHFARAAVLGGVGFAVLAVFGVLLVEVVRAAIARADSRTA